MVAAHCGVMYDRPTGNTAGRAGSMEDQTPHDILIRAAQYGRMSTEHQKYSIDNQRDVIGKYAAEHNMQVVQTYSDAGKSGLTFERRNALQSLITDVESGCADFSAVWRFRRRRTLIPEGTRTAFRAEGERSRSVATLAFRLWSKCSRSSRRTIRSASGGRAPIAENGVRGKGRQPLSPPQHTVTGERQLAAPRFLRMESPRISMRWALCTNRSKMPSAAVASPICSCQRATGSCEVRMVDRV